MLFPVRHISCASVPNAMEGLCMGCMLSEDLRTPHVKHKTGFKREVLIDESVLHFKL